jgi:hypothetical protein
LAEAVGVDFLASQRVAGFGEVDSDLVGAAGLELALDEGEGAEALDGADAGEGPLCAFGVGAFGGGAAESVAAVADEPGLDGAWFLEVAPDDGTVLSFDRVACEVSFEGLLGCGGEGEEHEAGGVAVEAVDGADGGDGRSVRAAVWLDSARGASRRRRGRPMAVSGFASRGGCSGLGIRGTAEVGCEGPLGEFFGGGGEVLAGLGEVSFLAVAEGVDARWLVDDDEVLVGVANDDVAQPGPRVLEDPHAIPLLDASALVDAEVPVELDPPPSDHGLDRRPTDGVAEDLAERG